MSVRGDKRDEMLVARVAKGCDTTGRITWVSEKTVVSSCSQTCSAKKNSLSRPEVGCVPVSTPDEEQHSPKSELPVCSAYSTLQIYCTAANAGGKATLATTAINAVAARNRYICFNFGNTVGVSIWNKQIYSVRSKLFFGFSDSDSMPFRRYQKKILALS